MRVVFMGTGAFAVPSLRALLDAGHEVAALVTQPDREKGRGQAVAAPPTKLVAIERGVPVRQFRRVREPAAQDELRALRPELQVVVAFGQILPRSVIEIAPLGTVNVHASLLPRYRGAAPIQWAVASGESETGVSTMLIDEGLDTGPVLLRRKLAIGPEETAGQLEPRLAALGAELLLETVDGLATRSLAAIPQDHENATLARILRKEDGRLEWSKAADVLSWRVRGFSPWPGSFCFHERRLLKVLRARPVPLPAAGDPGVVVSVAGDGVLVACGEASALLLMDVQPESRRAMPAAAWAAGSRVHAGVRLD